MMNFNSTQDYSLATKVGLINLANFKLMLASLNVFQTSNFVSDYFYSSTGKYSSIDILEGKMIWDDWCIDAVVFNILQLLHAFT